MNSETRQKLYYYYVLIEIRTEILLLYTDSYELAAT